MPLFPSIIPKHAKLKQIGPGLGIVVLILIPIQLKQLAGIQLRIQYAT